MQIATQNHCKVDDRKGGTSPTFLFIRVRDVGLFTLRFITNTKDQRAPCRVEEHEFSLRVELINLGSVGTILEEISLDLSDAEQDTILSSYDCGDQKVLRLSGPSALGLSDLPVDLFVNLTDPALSGLDRRQVIALYRENLGSCLSRDEAGKKWKFLYTVAEWERSFAARPRSDQNKTFQNWKKKGKKWSLKLFWTKVSQLPAWMGIPLCNGKRMLFSRDWTAERHALAASQAISLAFVTCNIPLFHHANVRHGRGYKTGVFSPKFPRSALFRHILRQVRGQRESGIIKILKNSLLNFFSSVLNSKPGALGWGSFHLGDEFQVPERYLGMSSSPQDDSAAYSLLSEDEFLSSLCEPSEFPELRTCYLELRDRQSGIFEDKLFSPSFEILPGKWLKPIQDHIANLRSPIRRAVSVRLAVSVLQSKAVFAEVGSDFVAEALAEHRQTICTRESRPPLHPKLLESIAAVSSEFGLIVKDLYQPMITVAPTTHACFENGRSNGGTLGYMREKGWIQFRDPFQNPLLPRCEPLLVGLFGHPGSGKTLFAQSLIQNFRDRVLGIPSCPLDDLVYFRNPHCDHWDGFKGQPIVCIDDFGQDTVNCPDLRELDQLVSSSTFYPPMASLESKGMPCRPLLVVATTNMRFGQSVVQNSQCPVLDVLSVWRRFDIPIRQTATKEDEEGQKKYSVTFEILDLESVSRTRTNDCQTPGGYDGCQRGACGFSASQIVTGQIYDLQEKEYSRKRDFYLEKNDLWCQTVSSVSANIIPAPGAFGVTEDVWLGEAVPGTKTSSLIICFPLHPPKYHPPCRVIPLPEPLKVRTITVGPASQRVLKPLQDAMFQAMGRYPEFSLTHNLPPTELEEGRPSILSRDPVTGIEAVSRALKWLVRNYDPDHEVLLSGDYRQATDQFRMEVSEMLLEGILKHIDHSPTKEWARWAISPSRLHYPDGSSCLQQRGQLMGGILSFPLLCLGNLALCLASGLQRGQFLINGDDLAARALRQAVHDWKVLGRNFGLDPSPGKYLVKRSVVMINSQAYVVSSRQTTDRACNSVLLYPDRAPAEENDFVEGVSGLLSTGKMKLMCRGRRVLGSTLHELQLFFPQEYVRTTFIRLNTLALSQTPRSPYVPLKFGGLCRRMHPNGRYFPYDAVKVYAVDVYRKIVKTPFKIGDWSIVPIPVISTGIDARSDPLVERLFNHLKLEEWLKSGGDPTAPCSFDEEDDDLSWPTFTNAFAKVEKTDLWKQLRRVTRLQELRPLNDLQYTYTIMLTRSVSNYQKLVLDLILPYLFKKTDFWSAPSLMDGEEEGPWPLLLNEPFLADEFEFHHLPLWHQWTRTVSFVGEDNLFSPLRTFRARAYTLTAPYEWEVTQTIELEGDNPPSPFEIALDSTSLNPLPFPFDSS